MSFSIKHIKAFDVHIHMPKQDHLFVFELLNELNFSIGKKLCIDLLRGTLNDRIRKLKLDRKTHFGCLGGYAVDELMGFLDYLIRNDLLTIIQEKGRFSVLALTGKGEQELVDRKQFHTVDDANGTHILPVKEKVLVSESITTEDKALFTELSFFLDEFTDEQKKAIIQTTPAQLCVAGAGSGKTKVLTHKIVYLVKFGGVNPKKILAVTFTRKARQEMQERLDQLLPDTKIRIETFNSFAEKELQRHGTKIYTKQKQMIDVRSFIGLVSSGIKALGFETDQFVNQYFTGREKRGKDSRQLFFSFLYDFRTILDAYILHDRSESFFSQQLDALALSEKIVAQQVTKLVLIVAQELEARGLRTYADQIIDCEKLYATNQDIIPTYDWVLVDEFQDVNQEQLRLLDLLAPKNIFVVGDPRQSIYAWRGSNPDLIYEAVEKGITSKHKEVTTLILTKNFRSTKQVVDLANTLLIDHPEYTDMAAVHERAGVVTLHHYSSEQEEAASVVTAIKELACPRNEVFVLSRTNKGLDAIAKLCKQEQISYLLRTDEQRQMSILPTSEQITLATVHAIKGLEAEIVFVIGTSTANYPCRAKDHRFVELLTDRTEYNQYEEERRILYVACTRAKKETHMSYYGARSPFLNSAVLKLVKYKAQQTLTPKEVGTDKLMAQRKRLRSWRFSMAKERSVPAYIIFSDKVLEQLLEFQPATLEDLHNINGLGKIKIAQFGEELLEVLH